MMASGVYPWMVIPVEKRDEYIAAQEKASANNDITDFSGFMGSLVRVKVRKEN